MQVPLQVAFEGMAHFNAIEVRITEEIEKLEPFSGRCQRIALPSRNPGTAVLA